MQSIRAEIYPLLSRFLGDIRRFFADRDCLEVETPLLNPYAAVEAHLDSFTAVRETAPKSPLVSAPQGDYARGGYLITSPEYSMKTLLTELDRDIFQIAHCFRAGERGSLHREEFLLLEWYRLGKDESSLMEECQQLLCHLTAQSYSERRLNRPGEIKRQSISQIFQRYAGCQPLRGELEALLLKNGLQGSQALSKWTFEELFHSVFLNFIEVHLGRGDPDYICSWPPELAALSQIEKGYARRFELYWEGIELANGYYELRTKEDYLHRFGYENSLRRHLGKTAMSPDQRLIAALEKRALPKCSGVAMGLDRLLMLLRKQESLDQLYGPGSMPDNCP